MPGRLPKYLGTESSEVSVTFLHETVSANGTKLGKTQVKFAIVKYCKKSIQMLKRRGKCAMRI